MSKTQLLQHLRKAAQRSLWVFTGCVEAISAQAARVPVITKRSSELPVFSQLQLFFFLRADDCNPLILAGFEGIGMAQLAASSLVDPLQRMPLVRSQLLCAAWTLRPPLPVPEKRWKPQPIRSKYLGVPKHCCLHSVYEGSNQSLLRKLHKHSGAASKVRAACQSCKRFRAMSKISRRRTTSLLHQGRLLCVHPESAQRKQLLDRSML